MAIYFVEAIGVSKVKIGFTTNMAQRMRDLSVGSPVPLTLYGLIDGTKDDEKRWHNTWDHLRSHGEWFFVTKELKREIGRACGRKSSCVVGMRKSAWIFQDRKQLSKLGPDDCPWSVGWYDAEGNRKSKTIGSKSLARSACEQLTQSLNAEHAPQVLTYHSGTA